MRLKLPRMESDVAQRVRRILADQLNVKPEELRDDATFDDYKADSLTRIELVLRLEEEFKLEIPKDDAPQLTDVKGAIAFIEKLVKTQSI
jgi:acyl carrier protein